MKVKRAQQRRTESPAAAYCGAGDFYLLVAAAPAVLPSRTAAGQIITDSAPFSAAAGYLPFSISFRL